MDNNLGFEKLMLALKLAKKVHPTMRVGQIIYNALSMLNKEDDLFYISDETIKDTIYFYLKKVAVNQYREGVKN